MGKINIYQIAKEAGVSTTTVSRVINGKDGVGNETRKRILEIIGRTNFEPRISKNKNDKIALILGTDVNPSSVPNFSSPYISKIIEGISSVYFDYDYNIILSSLSKVPKNADKYKVFCYKNNIYASIFVNLLITDTFVKDFSKVVPTICIGSSFDSDNIVTVRSDNEKGSYEAVKYLINMGHKKIAFLVPSLLIQDHIDRKNGYVKALEEHGIAYEPDKYLIKYMDYSQTGKRMLIEDLLSNKNDRPTAFFICDDSEVLKFLSILNGIGISIPEDLSIVGFDDYDYSEHFLPPLTTVRQPIYEMGREAALASLSFKVGDRGEQKILSTKLITRKSVEKNI